MAILEKVIAWLDRKCAARLGATRHGKDPKTLLTQFWFATIVLVLVVFIFGCAAATKLTHLSSLATEDALSSAYRSLSFVAVAASMAAVFVAMAGTVRSSSLTPRGPALLVAL